MRADKRGGGGERLRGVHLPADDVLGVHPAGLGGWEGICGGYVGLDVEDGRAVKQVGFGDLEDAALDGDEADAGKADRVGAVGGARGEHAHAVEAGDGDGRAGGGAPVRAVAVEEKDHPDALEAIEVAQGRLEVAAGGELDRAGSAGKGTLARRVVLVRGRAAEDADRRDGDWCRHGNSIAKGNDVRFVADYGSFVVPLDGRPVF